MINGFKIHVLGYGGAFDYETEGHSAFYIQFMDNKPFLVDCGATVLPKLMKHLKKNTSRFVKENDIIITHTHEDHVGSLSNNAYLRYFSAQMVGEKAATNIYAQPNVAALLKNKLLINNNHTKSQLEFCESNSFYFDKKVWLNFIDTTGHHFKDFATSGLVLTGSQNDRYKYLIISGDIDKPIFELIEKQNQELYNVIMNNPENVVVLHDATVYNYPDSPHCYFEKLLPYKEKFPYLYTYHHDHGQLSAMNQKGWLKFAGDFIDREIKDE